MAATTIELTVPDEILEQLLFIAEEFDDDTTPEDVIIQILVEQLFGG
jgi:hypothetical protein